MKRTLTVVVGVSGGIAAYKAVQVVRSLVLEGHDVHVLPTQAALGFVGLPTWEAISRNPVRTDVWDDVSTVAHVDLGRRADVVVVAPATANTIARLAAGLADDPLTVTALATTAPVVVAPAMHPAMWEHPATVDNIALLRSRGVTVVGPADGPLTGDDSGPGRMSEPDEIVAATLAAASPSSSGDLAGLTVVITAGGTREPLDPVRYVGNRSSGKQGVALAESARDRGADVVLIAAHVEVPLPDGVEVLRVETAEQLADAVARTRAAADLLVMAAAVADFRVEQPADAKIKKDASGSGLTLDLVRTRDALAESLADPVAGRVVVGFAAETAPSREGLLQTAREKLARKPVDLLALNRVGWTETFGQDASTVILLDSSGDVAAEVSGSKREVADAILTAALARRAE